MSSGKQPEFFFDRSLGRKSAEALLKAGWTIHLVADFYPADGADVPDEDWISEGCRQGWVLLSKDQRIRYRASELSALNGQLFWMANGNLGFREMSERFLAAGGAIRRHVEHGESGFWLVYENGRVERRWP